MPRKLYIDSTTRAQRHVLSQQLYRLRKEYQFFLNEGLLANALVARAHIKYKEVEYKHIGGKPHHRGNVV